MRRPEGVGRITSFRHDFSKPVGSEQRRAFLPSRYKLVPGRRDRGTNPAGDQKTITVQELVRSRWCSIAVQVVPKPRICHGTQSQLEGRCAYPGLRPRESELEAGLKRKNRDEFINATVRVMVSAFILFLSQRFYLQDLYGNPKSLQS